ncbi:serine carboxypeptidase S10 family protein [Acrasis kona]|uniref:Serine carboxypeptidase S10 family protein n=1 Tax=Acrasis kona TaxID=1008807 RepID=A0AAW2Z1G1_9EUKA
MVGPGCSSLSQLFFENGPFMLTEAGLAQSAARSWNVFANVLYLDQPLSTGFSKTTQTNLIPSDSQNAANDVIVALKQFLLNYPELAKRRVYFAGSDYSAYIIKTYKESGPDVLDIRGVAFGNALIKPSIQYGSYSDYGYASGILSYKERVLLNKQYESCLQDIQSGNYASAASTSCQPISDMLLQYGGNMSPTDIRRQISDVSWMDTTLVSYLSRPDVLAAINVNTTQFVKCNADVYNKFSTQELHSDLPDTLIPSLMDKYNISTLFYNDQFNVRHNTLGVQEALRQMMWSGREVFNQMERTILPNSLGHFKTYKYLSHAVIYGGVADPFNTQPTTSTATIMSLFTSTISTDYNSVSDALCDKPGCSRLALNCANNCSSHGTCADLGACKCEAGYSGLDCSIGDFTHIIANNKNLTYTGSMIGKEANVFRLVYNPSTALLGIDLVLTTTSPGGNPFMFLNVSKISNAPDGAQIKHIARQQVEYHVLNGLNGYSLSPQLHGRLSGGYFQYYNVSHDRSKEIHVSEVDTFRGEDHVISIAVFNYADVPCSFELKVSATEDSGRFELFGLFMGLSLAFLVIIILEIMVIMTRANNRRMLERSIMKSSSHRPILLHDEQDEDL